jgi:hypothetical protein
MSWLLCDENSRKRLELRGAWRCVGNQSVPGVVLRVLRIHAADCLHCILDCWTNGSSSGSPATKYRTYVRRIAHYCGLRGLHDSSLVAGRVGGESWAQRFDIAVSVAKISAGIESTATVY